MCPEEILTILRQDYSDETLGHMQSFGRLGRSKITIFLEDYGRSGKPTKNVIPRNVVLSVENYPPGIDSQWKVLLFRSIEAFEGTIGFFTGFYLLVSFSPKTHGIPSTAILIARFRVSAFYYFPKIKMQLKGRKQQLIAEGLGDAYGK